MAEERILVIKKDLHPCIGCNKEEECFMKCSHFFEWENSISRQEAIEKMENGWKKKAEEKLPIPLTAREVLEAALNALLEVEK